MYDTFIRQEIHRTDNLEGKVYLVVDGDRLQSRNEGQSYLSHKLTGLQCLSLT